MSAALNYMRIPLLAAESVDETASEWINVYGYKYLTIYLKGTGVTSSGVLSIDECDFNPATETGPVGGTYSVVQLQNASAVDGGLQVGIHLDVSAYAWIRTRISTVIGGGGTISTVLVAVS